MALGNCPLTPGTAPTPAAIDQLPSDTAVAAMGGARLVLQGGTAGAARVARHLWRMLTALVLAFGSGSGNGLAQLLPGPFHIPPLFLAPMLPWLIRVRLTGWREQDDVGLAGVDREPEGART